jgi:hypothetical protein
MTQFILGVVLGVISITIPLCIYVTVTGGL